MDFALLILICLPLLVIMSNIHLAAFAFRDEKSPGAGTLSDAEFDRLNKEFGNSDNKLV